MSSDPMDQFIPEGLPPMDQFIPEGLPPQGGSAVSIAELVETPVSIDWYEAIAIVQQLCETVIDAGPDVMFERASAMLHPSGDIVLTADKRGDPRACVQPIGELLQVWLADTPHPMPLRFVVTQATSSPPFYTTVTELFQALGFYERPNRNELVRGIYEQWHALNPAAANADVAQQPEVSPAAPWQKFQTLGASAKANAGELFRGMSERWRSSRTERGPSQPETEAAFPERETVFAGPSVLERLSARWNPRVAAKVALILVLAIAGGWFVNSYGGTAAASVGSVVVGAHDTVLDKLSSGFSAALDWLGTAYSHGRPNQIATMPSQASTAQRPADIQLSRRSDTTSPASRGQASGLRQPQRPVRAAASLPLLTPQGALASSAELSASPAQATAAAGAATTATQPSGIANALSIDSAVEPVIYSGRDADVIPPVAAYPHVPAAFPPGVREQDLAFIEIIVSETGVVESAKVVMAPETLSEAMVTTTYLSAVKSWRFEPALKDGKPVKYRRTVWVENR